MDQNVTEAIAIAGANLAELAVKGTAIAVNSKIQSIKKEKNADKIRNTYDEIVSGLLAEREDVIRTAQVYKEAYESVSINDEDIEYLHNTLEKIISIIEKYQVLSNEQVQPLHQLVELLNKDTLKTMQLLGFNYKEAIGKPLTEACANAILTKLRVSGNKKRRN